MNILSIILKSLFNAAQTQKQDLQRDTVITSSDNRGPVALKLNKPHEDIHISQDTHSSKIFAGHGRISITGNIHHECTEPAKDDTLRITQSKQAQHLPAESTKPHDKNFIALRRKVLDEREDRSRPRTIPSNDTVIDAVGGEISVKNDFTHNADVKSIHGQIVIQSSQSVRNVFLKAIHEHNGIASQEISNVQIDAIHGTVALKANHMKGVSIESTHDPVVIDTRNLESVEDLSVYTIHGDLLLVFDPLNANKAKEIASKISFNSVHGQIVLVEDSSETRFDYRAVSKTSYHRAIKLPRQQLQLSYNR